MGEEAVKTATTPSEPIVVVIVSAGNVIGQAKDVPFVGHRPSERIAVKGSVPRRIRLAVRSLDREEPFAVDQEVQFLRGIRASSLVEVAQPNVADSDSPADLKLIGTGIEQVLKVDHASFEGRRVDVRQIVGRRIQRCLEGIRRLAAVNNPVNIAHLNRQHQEMKQSEAIRKVVIARGSGVFFMPQFLRFGVFGWCHAA